jgi:hypothetical protein
MRAAPGTKSFIANLDGGVIASLAGDLSTGTGTELHPENIRQSFISRCYGSSGVSSSGES